MRIQLSSESRGKKKGKKKSGRSLMLSEVMPLLSGTLGEQLQEAIEKEDGDRAKKIMIKIGRKLKEKYEKA